MILPRGLAVLRFGTYRTSRHTYFYQVNRNLLQSSTSVPHTCILKFARLKSYKRNANKDLLPFRMINDCDDKKLNDDTFEKSVIDLHDKFHILLNPAKHADILNAPQNTAPSDSQSLQVSVVGIPNAGKSTLVNQLMGNNICAHSEKVHTTRQNALGILTKDSKQIIFQDTPGIICEKEKTKFGLEESLLLDPYKSCLGTDLILVVHDVSNRYVREAISKRILELLCRNPETPAVLVLNKLDTIPKSKRVYNLIRKLTCGRLNGIEQEARYIRGPEKKVTVDDYFKKRSKRLEENTGHQENIAPKSRIISSYDDLLEVLYENKYQEEAIYTETIDQLTRGLVGWPGFQDVFTVSALHGDGVDELREYMFEKAYPSNGYWKYDKNLLTDQDPRKLVVNILKSKLLNVLPNDVPYKIQPVIETWSADNGILRLLISITSNVPRVTSLLLSNHAMNLKQVAKLAEHDLQNLFQCEVFVLMHVNVTHGVKEQQAKHFTANDNMEKKLR